MLNIETYRTELFPDLIERIWIAENKEHEVELVIPPNQYVNVIFPLNNSKFKRNEIWINTPHIEGVSTENTVLKYPAETKLVGIRFYAFGLYPFLQIQGKKLINNSFEFLPETEKTKNLSIYSDRDLIPEIENIFSDLYCQKSYKSVFQVRDFYNNFRWNDKIYSIEDYCRKAGTNYTTLNRDFNRIIGISPKKFERLIKFRKSLCSLIDSKDKLTSIAVNSGYFDQAHFIREFKMFINQTPSSYQALIKLADKESKIINYNFNLL